MRVGAGRRLTGLTGPGTLATAAGIAGAAACTSFATVRSAEVPAGPSLTVQASVASPPGDEAAWFWGLDCARDCDRSIPGGDVVLAYGRTPRAGRAFTLGVGISGWLYPYAEGYLQLGGSARLPVGVGARLGLPAQSWTEHQVYGRVDVPLGDRMRLLWNPSAFYHVGKSPNGQNPGRFTGHVQGLGLQLGTGTAVVTPSVAVVSGRAERESYGQRYGPESRVFGTAALGVTLHGHGAPGSP